MKYLSLKRFKSEKESKMSCEASQMVNSKYFQKWTSKKSKRYRSAFTTEQINYLEQEFKKFPYIGNGNRKEVSNKLQIPERAVKIWFQNRRMKEKKECGNKEFKIENLGNDTTKFTNEAFNNSCNWQSNNDHRCSLVEEAKGSEINCSVKPCAKNITAAIPVIPIVKHNGEGVTMHNFSTSNSLFAMTKNSINDDAIPVAFQNVKNKPNVASVAKSKQKSEVKKQNKGPLRNCPLRKSYQNIGQDMPQDLSSRRSINKLYSQQPQHCPVNSIPGPGFIPFHVQNPYPSSVLPTGNVIWKPVNMLSTLPVPQPSAVSMGMPQNSTGVHFVNNQVTNTCSCSCNCHGSSVRTFNQVNARANPQYILAIPFSNPPK